MTAVVGSILARLQADATDLNRGLGSAASSVDAFTAKSSTALTKWDARLRSSVSVGTNQFARLRAGFSGSLALPGPGGIFAGLGARGTALAGKGVETATEQFRELAKTILLPVAALGTLEGAIEAFKGQLERADAANKLSQALGLSVEDLTRLQHAADLADISSDNLSTGLRSLAKNASAVADGAKGGAADAFAKLGVVVKGANGALKPTSDLLTEVADRFSKMRDSAQKTALAQQIFGRSGAALIPPLNEGRAGLKALADESDRLGLTISTKAAQGAEELNDSLARLGQRLEGVISTVVQDTIPAIQGAVSSITDLVDQTSGASPVLALLEGGVRDVSAFIVQMSGAVQELTDDIIGLQNAWLALTGKGGSWAAEAWFRKGVDDAAATDAKAKAILAGTYTPPDSGRLPAGGSADAGEPTGKAVAGTKAQTAAVDELAGALKEARRDAEDFAGTFVTDLASGKSWLDSLTDAVGDLEQQLIRLAANRGIEALFDNIGGVLGQQTKEPGAGALTNWAPSLFADGGHVVGPGTSTSDSIRAWLSNGEFVVNAGATRRNRAVLEAINDNRAPGYALGGMVGSAPALPSLAGFLGGLDAVPPINVTISHQPGAQDGAEAKRNDRGGLDIVAIVGGAAAKDAARPGGSLNRALRVSFGARQQLTRRGS